MSSKRDRPLLISSDEEDPFVDVRKRQRQLPTPSSSGASRSQAFEVIDITGDADHSSDDDLEDITPTQVQAEEELVSMGHVGCKIVGVQYYRGIATFKENLLFVREPRNPYDKNAIRVDNVANIQVGHIPREMAAILAPLLDRGVLQTEGTVAGERNAYTIPISIELFTKPVDIEEMEHRLRYYHISKTPVLHQQQVRPPPPPPVQPPRSQYISSSAPAPAPVNPALAYNNLVRKSVAFDPRAIRDVSEKFGMSIDDLQSLPMAKQPDQVSTKMLDYQLQGLKWMLNMEHPRLPDKDAVKQFWTKNGNTWINIATHYATSDPPRLARGGILADDMGLGKTLQIISLLVANPEDSNIKPLPTPLDATGTLIICPLSLLSNWTSQITQHLKPSSLTILVFHGSTKSDRNINLNEYDVVITSYGALVADWKSSDLEKNPQKQQNNKRSLFGHQWRRIVLDEGHTIRNPKSKTSIAATALESIAATALESIARWSLTGTPIINRLEDLFSQIRFLHFSGGFSDKEIFNRLIIRPMKVGDESAARILQLLMGGTCLRRRKDMKFKGRYIVELPGIDEYLYKIDFSVEERRKYDVLEKEAKGLLTKMNQGDQKGYSFVLELLLRMRQFSDHWSLCQERLAALIELGKASKVPLTPANITLLQQMMDIAIDAQEDCPICMDPIRNETARITTCKHIFCQPCIEAVILNQKKCPLCRNDLPDIQTTLVIPAEETPSPSNSLETMSEKSSKLDALLQILQATREKDETVKTIVFSQFTNFLDIIQFHLEKRGFKFVRLDGSMTVQKRDVALHTFSSSPTHTIMLASLAVCSVGLNLVAASQVILGDSWWAPSIEDQAVDRVHRLGQTRRVTVFRLVMKDSVEERVIEIQKNKRKMISEAFNEKKEKRVRETRMQDLRMLLSGSTT